jgi:hypothetical protein
MSARSSDGQPWLTMALWLVTVRLLALIASLAALALGFR